MPGLNVEVVGARELEYAFEKLADALRDQRPVMRRIRDQLYRDNEEIWNKGQETWADWSPAYAKWRATPAGYSTAPFGEMLDLSGRLRESLTSQDPDNIAIINRRSLTFGTRVPYASYVQEGGDVGGKYGPPKKSSWDHVSDPFRLPRNFAHAYTEAMERRWRRIVEDYVKEHSP